MEGTKLRELYWCPVCGNLVELVNEGAPALVCCGKPMERQNALTADAGKEKHVPVMEEIEDGVLIKVGDIPHPMEEKHYIKFIEVLTDTRVYRKELKPGDAPEAKFKLQKKCIKEVREWCTIHKLWKS